MTEWIEWMVGYWVAGKLLSIEERLGYCPHSSQSKAGQNGHFKRLSSENRRAPHLCKGAARPIYKWAWSRRARTTWEGREWVGLTGAARWQCWWPKPACLLLPHPFFPPYCPPTYTPLPTAHLAPTPPCRRANYPMLMTVQLLFSDCLPHCLYKEETARLVPGGRLIVLSALLTPAGNQHRGLMDTGPTPSAQSCSELLASPTHLSYTLLTVGP